MQGRAFLKLAHENLVGADDAHWRGAAGRAYYALMLECRDALFRWGFRMLRRENVHAFVRLRFTYPANSDLHTIGRILDFSVQLRNRADYNLTAMREFATDGPARKSVQDAESAIDLLDAIEVDPARKAAAIAAVRLAFP